MRRKRILKLTFNTTLIRASMVLLSLWLTGCITVYEPLTSLQHPTTIDIKKANFNKQSIFLDCKVPTGGLDLSSAETLCQHLAIMLENQGAKVTIFGEEPAESSSKKKSATTPKYDLIIDIESKLLNEKLAWWMVILSIPTLTFYPVKDEFTFEQRVLVKNSSGFLLADEVHRARMITYFGAGVWLSNIGLNATFRDEFEQISEEATSEDFSRDLYSRVSQIAYNAKIRMSVLNSNSK